MSARLDGVRERLKDLDALFVSSAENRRWLSGFSGSAGYLVITGEAAVLATDFRYTEQAGQQAPDYRIHRIGGGMDWARDLFAELGAARVGFESADLTYATYRSVTEALATTAAVSFVPTTGVVEPLRMVKDDDEAALITRAVEIADLAFEAVAPTIEVGETEESVAWRLDRTMREAGAEAVSFETIVAAGPNAAKPHHRPSERPIQAGEPVVIDMGARFKGYCSDMTRTICLGPADETFRVVYDTVLGAQLTAIATVNSGMNSGEIDAVARDIIQQAGYGDQFGHSLGHGIGLAVHEHPRVGPRGDDAMADGTVFTIEPGIYIPGWGGVRIEDTVIMEGGVVRTLNRAHKREDPRSA
ncbi:MAG: aminopeptidase P family protein [Candidatus Brocadiia bacterium]|nr:aminopeptidase P family protein [Candidatus Brocadiia bacterium]